MANVTENEFGKVEEFLREKDPLTSILYSTILAIIKANYRVKDYTTKFSEERIEITYVYTKVKQEKGDEH